MRHSTRCSRVVRCLALAAAVTVSSGCFGDEDDLYLYCLLMSSFTNQVDFDECLGDYNPEEFAEMRQYLDDVRAYQQLLEESSLTGPGAPSFEAFMSARYADWDERAGRLAAIKTARAARAVAASTH